MPKRFQNTKSNFSSTEKNHLKKNAITLKFVLSIFQIFFQRFKKKKRKKKTFSLIQLSIIHQINVKSIVNFFEEISTEGSFVKYLDFDFSTQGKTWGREEATPRRRNKARSSRRYQRKRATTRS